ncbi:sulfate/molybdate ABC transporter ATP-binding protein [Enhygromyxa salina]|uniref:Sulfate/thiosulfate import ATP-binding protein CysA n=1 Tax=Enhygromyxa salina TaxID=215803 RepID=A0A2S9XU96_9BACT|nr:ATP-binding cassette domain-containing protein [Enhygromyxa salina]PRP96448.1 Sulfate/thiosulfate import ATP-binding protein CysA [Enhygromyxa salina]
MTLRADLHLTLGEFTLDLAFSAPEGEVLAVVGQNGAGKSTVLAAIAGLIPLQRGEIVLDGHLLERVATGIRLPPQARRVGVLFQGLALFEHLSALDNVAYGLRARGLDKRSARARAHTWLERFGIDELAQRRPRELSGGQAQRVALARALICEPQALLLDEPLVALDAQTRLEVREVLRETLGAFAGVSLLVTHELDDAVALADHLLVLDAGKLAQEGSPEQVIRAPATAHLRAMLSARRTGSTPDPGT